jgi:hypothetical protein
MKSAAFRAGHTECELQHETRRCIVQLMAWTHTGHAHPEVELIPSGCCSAELIYLIPRPKIDAFFEAPEKS